MDKLEEGEKNALGYEEICFMCGNKVSKFPLSIYVRQNPTGYLAPGGRYLCSRDCVYKNPDVK